MFICKILEYTFNTITRNLIYFNCKFSRSMKPDDFMKSSNSRNYLMY